MRVLISGGGTGGHLFPAIAVAQALSRNAPDSILLYVGRRGGIEEQVVPRYRFTLETIVAPKLDMEQLWRNWSFPLIAPRALWQAASIVRRFQPNVVLGTGGYVSAPLILAAAARRIPVVLQEQNLLPGRTTRWLSRFARVVATGYEESGSYLHTRSVVTGTPVRDEFTSPRGSFPSRPQRVLILGGSQGAHRINEAMAAATPELTGHLGMEVWHQTGGRDLQQLETLRASLGEAEARYHPFGFADDLASIVQPADLVLSRAGASAISEVSAVGIPMILVPGPFAGGHQRLNAEPFVRAGAAVMIPDEACDGPRIVQEISAIVQGPTTYRKMVDAMHRLGRPRAADDVVTLLQSVAKAA
ncbi:MAG TPA: undecaprenyldiphospho-muramoylpentapeptide beta-N-acetylglucosaminyltransferase [Candidatus Dormibacteraeota bacterium]|nr:undecaprenyldiphospho-muramoylpentapeptide beta-N-acetylglucosaminyltransferase [Candidatus Dormibacteraeota bacterium]